MAKVFDVADFFVWLANQREDDQITNLKLNKMLYYAQGAFLERTGKPLFDSAIEAWQYGPVIPEIYHKYKVCGKNPISFPDQEIDRSLFTEDEFEVLLDVMREFGQYTGAHLVTLTHLSDTPWSEAFEKKQTLIPLESMKAYFQNHPVPRLIKRISVPQVTSLPSDWYDPEEDAEWEDYL